MPVQRSLPDARSHVMRGRSSAFYRVRINLARIPVGERPAAAPLDPAYDPIVEWRRAQRAGAPRDSAASDSAASDRSTAIDSDAPSAGSDRVTTERSDDDASS